MPLFDRIIQEFIGSSTGTQINYYPPMAPSTTDTGTWFYKQCPWCLQFLPHDARFCCYCGKELETKHKCPTCGKEID